MYIGSQNQLKGFDSYLLSHGYTIEELINYASDCLLPHFRHYKKVCLLVGPGNNGADALSLALKLNEHQIEIDIYYIGDYLKFSSGNQYYFNQCIDMNLNLIQITEKNLEDFSINCNDYDVIGDGFFGFGLNSAPRGLHKSIIDIINQHYLYDIIAIDIPTGLNCNTGIPYSTVLFASKTISLTALKEGYLNPESQMITGEVIVEELNIDNPFVEAGLYQLVDYQFAVKNLKDRKFDGYKNYYGVDLLIAGSQEYRGAPLLASKGAMYSGAGIVKLMSHSSVINTLPMVLPEIIGIERPITLNKSELTGYNAILIGPGLGLDIDSYTLVSDVLLKSNVPLVIDADALTILASNKSLLRNQKRSVVLTPHLGEFKRLYPLNSDDDLMEVAIEFAKENNVILVLKGPHTIVTDGQTHYRMESGNKAMAVGGMGDTLAGMITAFLGQQYNPLTAVLLAVYIHGFTGDVLARKRYTVMPELLSEHIPQAMYIINNNLKESS